MAVTNVGASNAAAATTQKTGFSALGAKDFIKLLTAQLSQQDPTDPVDNKDMLAQMAQFSSLSGITETNDTLKGIATKLDKMSGSDSTLKDIASKLDAILAAQKAAGTVAAPSATDGSGSTGTATN